MSFAAIEIGTVVAVVHVRIAITTQGRIRTCSPSCLTRINRLTKTSVVTDDGRLWSITGGEFKATPTSRPDSVKYISIEPADIQLAVRAEAKAKAELAQKALEARLLKEWRERPDVQLAVRLDLSAYTNAQAIKFWLRLGEERLRRLIDELEAVKAFKELE